MPPPEAEHPPAAPGPGATPYHCRCGNLLGILDRRWLFTHHRGRVVDAALSARVRCESCRLAGYCAPMRPPRRPTITIGRRSARVSTPL